MVQGRKSALFIFAIVLMISLSLVLVYPTQEKAGKCNKAKKEVVTSDVSAKITKSKETAISPEKAMQKLVKGNKRYLSGNFAKKNLSKARREDLFKNGQKPFAVIVTCSDSRVSPELMFDQGIGDLFVVRTAGNVVDKIEIGSIEYAAEHLKAPLIVVIGHQKCGAVKAAVDGGEVPENIGAIVSKIKPSVDKVAKATISRVPIYENVADENVKAVIANIETSPVIKKLLEEKEIEIKGGKYSLETGKVTFLN